MPKFRNEVTGTVVEVRDGKDLTGYGYVPIDGGSDAAAATEAPAEEPAAPAEEGGGTEGYHALKVADLRAEVERRNEGREEGDLLPVEGKKADLIAALEADDTK